MVSTPQMCARLFYKNMDQTRPLFVYFRPFFVTMTNTVQQTINGKSIDDVFMGFEPGTAEWMAQTDPLRYGGPLPRKLIFKQYLFQSESFLDLIKASFIY